MIFWAARFLVGLVALWALLSNWRVGIIILFSLAADFVTYLWMAMPLFSVRYEWVVVLAAGLVVGVMIRIGRNALSPPWLAGVIGAVVLVLLRGSLYLQGLAKGMLGSQEIVATLPSAVVLVVGTGAALLIPALIIRRRGPTSS